MNRIIKVICLLLVLASCERHVDFPVVEHGRIHVDAIIGKEQQDRININVSQPALGSEATCSEDVTLQLEVDGQQVLLKRDAEYVPEYEGEISYLIPEKLHPGQNLKLTAQAENLPQVQAHTSVPELVENVEISDSLVEVYKNDLQGGQSENMRTLREFKITIADELDDEGFWGVQVRRRSMIDSIGTVPPQRWEVWESRHGVEESEVFYVNSKFGVGVENELSSIDVEMIVDFRGEQMRVTSSSTEADGSVVKVYVVPTRARRLLEGEYTGKVITFEIYENTQYNITVHRLSPEMYYCMRAQYILKYSSPDESLGFSSPSYLYTNVEGGLGMFGAMSTYESGWINVE